MPGGPVAEAVLVDVADRVRILIDKGVTPGLGTILGVLGILTSLAVGLWGIVYWIRNDNFPGPLFLGGLVLFVLGLQGFLMAVVGENLQRIQRDVERRPLYYIERELG